MTYKEQLRDELSRIFECDPAELSGQNVIDCLSDADGGEIQVAWGCVSREIKPTETF